MLSALGAKFSVELQDYIVSRRIGDVDERLRSLS